MRYYELYFSIILLFTITITSTITSTSTSNVSTHISTNVSTNVSTKISTNTSTILLQLDSTKQLAYQKFQIFIQDFSRNYANETETAYRFSIFEENLHNINLHNANPMITYVKGINRFTDMTQNERKEFRLRSWSYIQNTQSPIPRNCTPWNKTYSQNLNDMDDMDVVNVVNVVNVDFNFDWREKGIVSPVKNQGECGSCWAFSTTGAIEGALALKTGLLLDLSVQQMVDCANNWGTNGCGGGMMDNAYRYVADTGQCSQQDYPYTGKYQNCNTKCLQHAHVRDCVVVPNNETIMAQVLMMHGPISVAIDTELFVDYSSGVVNGTCQDSLDHAVLIVGFGNDNVTGLDYWLIKNSWGKDWGENGYVRMTRGANMCGITKYVSFPIIR